MARVLISNPPPPPPPVVVVRGTPYLYFRNPFPEPLLLTVVLKSSGEQTGKVETEDDRGSVGNGSGMTAGAEAGRRSGGGRRFPFLLLLKKTTDLVLQPFQALQVYLYLRVLFARSICVCVSVRVYVYIRVCVLSIHIYVWR